MDHPFELEVLVAQKLARSAGEMAKLMKTGSSYSFKDNNEGPVSEADLKADLIIRNGLRAHFPHDLVISEETAQGDTPLPLEGRVWLVDPIDGTNDYVIGGLDYSVMIGLLIDGLPALGIVFGPETDEMWTGVIWAKNGEKNYFAQKQTHGASPVGLDIRQAPQISALPTVTASKNHPSKVADAIIANLHPAQIIKKGSLGLKMGLIADGKADFYVATSKRIKAWDTCAPIAILQASGGFAYTFGAKELIFGPTCTHTMPFFATSSRYAKYAIESLRSYPIF